MKQTDKYELKYCKICKEHTLHFKNTVWCSVGHTDCTSLLNKSNSQIDKCECNGHIDEKGKRFYYIYCNCKSHSQTERNGCSEKGVKELKYANTSQGVRASEEENKGTTCKRKDNPVDLSSSVPYTPLTKEMLNYYHWYEEEDVLSALNGLRENLLYNFPTPSSQEVIKETINKWFPILKDSEDKKK